MRKDDEEKGKTAFPPGQIPPNSPLLKPLSVKNDYCQHFVDTGERPQNFIRNVEPSERFLGNSFILTLRLS
jgi:hypothetical protein